MMPSVTHRDPAVTLRGARRIHIIGSSGAGKSHIADRLGTALGLPVHHLDDVALHPGTGSLRPLPERLLGARAIAEVPEWLSEGIYLGWTDVLLRSADTIIWLDNVSSAGARLRIVRRFVRDAVATARVPRTALRVDRLRDYRRHLRALGDALRETRRYHRVGDPAVMDVPDASSWAATAAALSPHEDKVISCRHQRDVDRVLRAIT